MARPKKTTRKATTRGKVTAPCLTPERGAELAVTALCLTPESSGPMVEAKYGISGEAA